MKMQSNPVQIRIDALVEEWNRLRATEDLRLVRLLHREEEASMVEAFCTYLLSEDSPNPDIPILFESNLDSHKDFATELLWELHGLVEIWNRATLADGTKNAAIDWRPDRNVQAEGNPARPFVANFNRLATTLGLPEEGYLVAVFIGDILQPKDLGIWMGQALDAGLASNVRFLVLDTKERRVFDDLLAQNPKLAKVLTPDLGMDEMMGQIAAMGNPNDPVVQYRKSLVALTAAIGKRQKKEVDQAAAECLRIAHEQADGDPLWYGQVLVVETLLCNDQIGYKDWKRAIFFATRGVDEMRFAATKLDESYFAQKFIAQAVMTRGAVHIADRDWPKAAADFEEAAGLYAETSDTILCIEAYRMLGYTLIKDNQGRKAAEALSEGFVVAQTMPISLLPDTSFPGLVKLLLTTAHERWVPHTELDRFLGSIWGKDWQKAVQDWGNPKAAIAAKQWDKIPTV